MNADEIRDLAALYALGGLDGDDRARFEALLAEGDATAIAAVREFEGTLVDLAAADTATPPPSVKRALMDRIAAEAGPAVVRPMPAPRRSWWPAVWAGAMAAGIAAIAVGLGMSASYQKRLDALAQETRALQAEVERQRAVLDLVRDPAAQVVALAGQAAAPEARARMIWSPQGGLLVAAGLPPAPAGKAYQLWAIAGQNAPVSAGVFEVDPKGVASLRVPKLAGVEKVDVFAVTLEPAGGLPAPSGPMMLVGKS